MAQVKLFRITGSGFVKQGSITQGHPVAPTTHWKEVVDEADSFLEAAASSEEEESVVELWLEDPQSFQAAFDEEAEAEGIVKSRTAGSMIRHADNFNRRTAAVQKQSWDQDFAEAKSHVANILNNLGNADRDFHFRPPTPGKVK